MRRTGFRITLNKLLLSIIIIAVFATSCKPEKKTNLYKSAFEYFFDFREEIRKLDQKNPLVKRVYIQDGVTETTLDTVNWQNELEAFLEPNINKPKYVDSYAMSTVDGQGSKIVKYVAKEPDLPVRSIELIYEDELCKSVYMKKSTTDENSYTNYELYYQPGIGYAITGKRGVKGSHKTNFEIRGKIYDFPYGVWRATMHISGQELPFNMEVMNINGACVIDFMNGEERIRATEIRVTMDSMIIKMPVFNSVIKVAFKDNESLVGNWYNYHKGDDYIVPLTAKFGNELRFLETGVRKPGNVEGKWETEFSPGKDDAYKAIGKFYQDGSRVTGTFMTETGDYRYLEGIMVDDSLFLSCFDGSHAFLFKAVLKPNGTMAGMYWSGNHWSEPWVAKRNEDFKLSHPDSITRMKPGESKMSFTFPDLKGNEVSLTDERFKDKVVIVNVMASWCPNCKDETAFLTDLYQVYHSEGLEVIALCYENGQSQSDAVKSINRHKQYFNAAYDFLIAGRADKKEASASLPMLTEIISFPTTIYIDRTGKVRKVQTGFYGPGTGDYHTQFVNSTTNFIEKLIRERS